jgi:hypothetical protein
MRKGISSMDAFLAIMMVLSVSLWLQNFFNLNFGNTQDLGTASALAMEAVKMGSAMNSFFAANPSAGDYLKLNSSIKLFANNLTVYATKQAGIANLSLTTAFNGKDYNSSYAVASAIGYDSTTGKVTS